MVSCERQDRDWEASMTNLKRYSKGHRLEKDDHQLRVRAEPENQRKSVDSSLQWREDCV